LPEWTRKRGWLQFVTANSWDRFNEQTRRAATKGNSAGEELLFAGPQALGFAKGLFQGRFVADWVMPYPRMPAAQQTELDESLGELQQFLDEDLDGGR
jgi:hypothetical protein